MTDVKKAMLLYAVTDRAWSEHKDFIEQCKKALEGGITCLQLREKHLSYDKFLQEALELKKLCSQYNVPLIINDNVDVAIACKADGIHVGQEDMEVSKVRDKVGPDMIIGLSAHDVDEALKAVKAGADYIGAGAVFATKTKDDVDIMSFETLKDICNAVSIPVVAIGGIKEDNMHLLKDSGIDGVAVVSAIFAADDEKSASLTLLEKSKELFAK